MYAYLRQKTNNNFLHSLQEERFYHKYDNWNQVEYQVELSRVAVLYKVENQIV